MIKTLWENLLIMSTGIWCPSLIDNLEIVGCFGAVLVLHLVQFKLFTDSLKLEVNQMQCSYSQPVT